MTNGVYTRLDGSTLIVHIPMRFQPRGGRNVSTLPLLRQSRAWRWQRMLEGGEYATRVELADAERISPSYACRVLRLTLLAPDIVERVLDGQPTVGLAQLMKPFPVEWDRQRTQPRWRAISDKPTLNAP